MIISTTNSISINDLESRNSSSMNQDSIERMIKYINWFAKISLNQASILLKTKKLLIKNEYSFQTIDQIFNTWFIDMNILDDMIFLLRSEMMIFKKIENKE